MTDLAPLAALLVLATLAGFLLGWLRREVTHKRQLRESRTRWDRRLQRAEGLRVQASEELRKVREELKDQASAAEFLESTLTTTRQADKKRLAVAELRIKELVRQLESATRTKSAEETLRAQARETTAEVLEDELATANEQLDTCSKELAEARSRIRQLDLQLERSSRQQISDAAKAKNLEGVVADRDKAVRKARKQLDAQDLLRTTLHQDLAATHQALVESETKLPELTTRISELEAQISAFRQVFSVSGEKDDLKRIRGIGKAFERKLNGLGVDTFFQVAAWDDAEIDRIAAEMGGSRTASRIRRDNWVGGARRLLAEKLAAGGEIADH